MGGHTRDEEIDVIANDRRIEERGRIDNGGDIAGCGSG
jgi:hypothetical protein